ncbi:MAG: metal-sensing transcriptional repressor [Dorea sp.]|nr:metal-sensing transcriptional repressor [Dorea sp.]
MRSHTHGAELHSRAHGTGSHRHVHSMEEKKAVLNRLSKAIGHLEAVKRMVERDEDCSEVLIQLAAVRSAINNAGKVVLKNHINHCIVEAVEENDKEAIELLNQAIDKFMK